jgi:hypothetical protein
MTGAAKTVADLEGDPSYQALGQTIAMRSSPIIAFVGSGLSSNLPSWSALQAHLVDVLQRKASRLDPTAAKAMAERADDAMRGKNLWASFSLLQSALGTTTYRAEVRSQLDKGDTLDPPKSTTEYGRRRSREYSRQIWTVLLVEAISGNILAQN